MINSSEDVVLMMNGEVYNAFDFKDELIAKVILLKVPPIQGWFELYRIWNKRDY